MSYSEEMLRLIDEGAARAVNDLMQHTPQKGEDVSGFYAKVVQQSFSSVLESALKSKPDIPNEEIRLMLFSFAFTVGGKLYEMSKFLQGTVEGVLGTITGAKSPSIVGNPETAPMLFCVREGFEGEFLKRVDGDELMMFSSAAVAHRFAYRTALQNRTSQYVVYLVADQGLEGLMGRIDMPDGKCAAPATVYEEDGHRVCFFVAWDGGSNFDYPPVSNRGGDEDGFDLP